MHLHKISKLVVFICILTMMSCNGQKQKKEENNPLEKDTTTTNSNSPATLQRCATMQVLEHKMTAHPEYRQVMERIETFCQSYEMAKKENDTTRLSIPVVVHVIYSTEEENISKEQIHSQIDVLNEDFNKQNADIDQVPAVFETLIANIGIHFDLKEIKRISSERKSWGTNDEMKFSTNGGSDAISPDTHLNIWVCPIGASILGYAQFPGLGEATTDGIVVSPQFFGTTGFVQAPFDKGRTATHEVGHWLNLRHIWGDGACEQDDFVDDTPVSNKPNNGCPTFPVVNCNSNDMFMNYMDYTNDACMHLFTKGQKTRIDAIFAAGGPRESFVKNLQ